MVRRLVYIFMLMCFGMALFGIHAISILECVERAEVSNHKLVVVFEEPEPEDETEIPDSMNLVACEFQPIEQTVEPELDEVSEIHSKVDTDELSMLSALIFLEAGSESFECQKAVGSVVINRMNVDNQSMYDVIYAPNQFSPASQIPDTIPTQSCIDAAEYVLRHGSTIPTYVTYFRANYYFDWAIPYANIDNTYFSYTRSVKSKVEEKL